MLLLQVTPIADSSSRYFLSFGSVSVGARPVIWGSAGFTDFKSTVLLIIVATDSLRFETVSKVRLCDL